MKKFLLGIILPVLTLVTLIGTGFATWYFNGELTETSKPATTTVSVEKYAQIGEITVSQGTYQIKLDQPSSTKQNITLVETKALTTPAELTGTYAAKTVVDDQADTTIEADFTITVTLTANLAKYITLDQAKGWTTTDNLTFTKDAVKTNGSANNTLKLTSDDFKYASAGVGVLGEPKDKKAYDDMVTAASGQNITVKFEAKMTKPSA